MAKYLLKRIGYSVLTILVLATLTFFMLRLLPGDPFTGEKIISDEIMASLEAKYGLDKPLWQQYFIYMGNAIRGDFGISISDNRDVTDKLMATFPISCELGIRALIFAVTAGVLLGIVAAVKRGTAWDTGSMLIALIGVSVPSFIVGSLLQFFLSLKLYQLTGIRFFPVTGWTDLSSKILPSFAMGFSSLATVARLMRTSMLDVLGQDYIKTAKAKGLSQQKIIWRHAVRNAILPVVTVLGPITASVLTGGFVIESIFLIPGMGRSFVTGIQQLDYTLVMGTTIFYGTFLILATLVVDILYGFIDPRIKLTKGGE